MKRLLISLLILCCLSVPSVSFAKAEQTLTGKVTEEGIKEAVNYLKHNKVECVVGWENALILQVFTRKSHKKCVTWQAVAVLETGEVIILTPDYDWDHQMDMFIKCGDHVLFDANDGDYKVMPPVYIRGQLVDEIRVIRNNPIE